MQDYGVTSSTALLATASPSRGGRACLEVDVKSPPQARYLDKKLGPADNPNWASRDSGGQQQSTRRRSLRRKLLTPLVTQEFQLRSQRDHARSDAPIFFCDPGDRSIDRAPVNEALKLLINAQAQHLFAPAGSISFSKIEQDDVEQGLELKRGLGRKHGHQFLGYVVGHPT